MIFLGNFNKISATKWQVGFIHHMPFDEEQGIKDQNGNLLTPEQINQLGILVNSIPEEAIPEGKVATGLFINPVTKEMWYEYTVKQPTEAERLAALESALAALMGV